MHCIHSKTLPYAEFCGLAERLVRSGRADLFLSGRGYPGENMSYIGVDIDDELTITGETSREEISRFVFSTGKPALGFLNYPLGFAYHGLKSSKTSSFRAGVIRRYKYYLKYNAQSEWLEVLAEGEYSSIAEEFLAIPRPLQTAATVPKAGNHENLRQSLSREEYIKRVGKTLDYIRDGYIYQLNLSIKYTTPVTNYDSTGLFLYLWRTFPAPFYVWFNLGRYQMFSTSPERFLRVDGGCVRSEPIKGTLAFDALTPDLKRYLKESPKESAELSMIVDMVRNDISMNCQYGSVRVRNHKSIFAVDNLLQMYSTVTGELKAGKTSVDLLLDAFPGGSITGCPKRKAIEIIDRLEPHARDGYCGAFFRIDDEQTMDSSITIRTGYYDKIAGELSFFAGSGIVADSDPEREYEETTAKAGKFLKVLDVNSPYCVP